MSLIFPALFVGQCHPFFGYSAPTLQPYLSLGFLQHFCGSRQQPLQLRLVFGWTLGAVGTGGPWLCFPISSGGVLDCFPSVLQPMGGNRRCHVATNNLDSGIQRVSFAIKDKDVTENQVSV